MVLNKVQFEHRGKIGEKKLACLQVLLAGNLYEFLWYDSRMNRTDDQVAFAPSLVLFYFSTIL